MHIFAALTFPQSAKDLLHALAQSHTDEGPWRYQGKWVALDNYHLTLRYIGHVDDETHDRYTAALKTI